MRTAVTASVAAVALVPDVARVLEAALGLRAASLVVFRTGALVEIKTDRLRERLSLYEEDGHESWQVGSFDDHHCHLDLASVRRIAFEAEPVPCQGGRINYTVWFLGERDCGNPFRPEGLFSVTFNRPYDAEGRLLANVVRPMYELYRRERALPFVSATDAFVRTDPDVIAAGRPAP